MKRVKRTERGWPGHYVLAEHCTFRRNTLIECGRKKIVVSTVGRMFKYEMVATIGCGRYYETMAFKAKFEKPYWEVDVTKKIEFTSPWAIHEIEHGSDLKANAMHEAVVEEITNRMSKGG